MVEVEFIFNGIKTLIKCNEDDKMNDIFNKYIIKINKNINDIYFVYDGKNINENSKDLTFNQFTNKIDKERKKMNILVYDKNVNKEKKSIIKSKEIICSKCGESIKILIKDYKIKLYGCKNGDEINNLSFEEFEKSQNIDESKIICDKCKEVNKGNTFENIFYKCNSCKMNLCPLCKTNHEQLHNKINYDLKCLKSFYFLFFIKKENY